MKLPAVEGLIRRRVLVNYRVDPQVVARLLPEGFRPKLHAGHAIAGICLIRLEEVRPRFLPAWTGIASENAAHRIAVLWDEDGETREGVFIPRRDTGSLPNYLAGGRLFPKVGAEGVYCIGVPGAELGIALKVEDGAKRAVGPAVLSLLRELDLISEDDFGTMSAFAFPRVLDTRGEPVGELRAHIHLRAADA